MIHKINFERSTLSLILDADDLDEDEVTAIEIDRDLIANFNPVMQVDIDLTISAHLNVMRYFEIKKKSYSKEQKTKDAAEQAVKQAEMTAARDLAKFKI
jgi:hypothetical protein